MKTAEMPVLEKPVKASVQVDPRLRSAIKFLCVTLAKRQVGLRDKLQQLATQQGYNEDDFDAAFKYLVQVPVELTSVKEEDSPRAQDASFDPHKAGRRLVEELKGAAGGAWTGPELEKEFKMTASFLHRRRKEFRIIYWRDAQGNFHYPKWQFNPVGALLVGIEDALQLLQSRDEWRVMRYFLGNRDQLDGLSPLELLRKGQVEKVVAHTQTHVEENTW